MEVYDFGLRLKELREAKKLSQKEAAARLEVGRTTISGYEHNIDYIMGLTDRPFFYVDDLEEHQQQVVLDIVDRLRREFLKGR